MHTVYRYGDRILAIDLRRGAGSRFTATLDGRGYEIDAAPINATTLQLSVPGRAMTVHVAQRGGQVHVALDGIVYVFTPDSGAAGSRDGAAYVSPEVTAPMPGKVLRVFVRDGQAVSAGDDLLILEAMKMETRLTADGTGTVRRVLVEEGQMVDGGQIVMEIEYQA